MPTIYTKLAGEQLPLNVANTWSRRAGIRVTGDITYLEGIYTVPATGAAVTGDLLRIARLPSNAIVIPHLCKIIAAAAMGTAFNIAKIGDIAADGVTTADNDARYSTAIAITAGGAFDFTYAAQAAGLAGYTTEKEMWLTATLGTITALTVAKTVRFVIAYAVTT